MADTASRNGRKNTTQSRKTGTQGRKTSTQGRTSMQKSSQRKKTGKKNAQTQTNQLKNDCIILFSIACAIILILSNFNIAGTLGRGIKWLIRAVWCYGICFSSTSCGKYNFSYG